MTAAATPLTPETEAKVQEIGERLQARTGITFPRSKWPMS